MKKLILTAVLGIACVSALAQGQLNFANATVGVNAPVFTDSNMTTKLAGTAYAADIYWAAGTVTDSSSLSPLGASANFLSGAQAGYFTGGARTIVGQPGGNVITVQVRVSDTADGTSYAAAYAAGLAGSATAVVGSSKLFQVTLNTVPPGTPASLTGLGTSSWFVGPVPEPSTMALAGLGAAALLIFRRRK